MWAIGHLAGVVLMRSCVVFVLFLFFFFKQKTAYEVRISLVGSDMCIRDLVEVVSVSTCGDWSWQIDRLAPFQSDRVVRGVVGLSPV